MENKLKLIVKILTERNQTISTMESCTGGGLANAITNIEGASNIIKFSAITYSNDYKIKMGVSKEIIDKYTVYSIETAREMAKSISAFTSSDYGVGITGKLNRVDPNNLSGNNNEVFISIYKKETNQYYDINTLVTKQSRKENKEEIIDKIADKILSIIKM